MKKIEIIRNESLLKSISGGSSLGQVLFGIFTNVDNALGIDTSIHTLASTVLPLATARKIVLEENMILSKVGGPTIQSQ